MKDKILKALVEHNLLQKIIIRLDKWLSSLVLNIFPLLYQTNKNNVLFITTRGSYDCNPKWICEEIIKQKLPWHLTWTIRDDTQLGLANFPPQLHLVKRGSFEFYKAASEAKIIIDNSVSLSYLNYKKKKDQIFFQTWHGSIGIKRFAADTNSDKQWIRKARISGQMTDYCISNSTFENDLFRNTFWKKPTILTYGHARNDILLCTDKKKLKAVRERIFTFFALENHIRICLYAPTFRDDNDLSPYLINYEVLRSALIKRFGGEWVILTRFHFKSLPSTASLVLPDFVINSSEYPDIQELLTCVDVGITDYSSWICEYMLTKRPGFLFATDMEHYESAERDFFYPLDSLPFPLATNNDQLIYNIEHFDNQKFIQDCEAFLRAKGSVDDGHASERIVKKIKELMKEGLPT